MKINYSHLLKHSSVYAVGVVLGRIASLLMLPIYTRYLLPSDYGIIAILDLTVAILGILVRSGISESVNRFHFNYKSAEDQNAVWWGGLGIVISLVMLILLPAWVFCDHFAWLFLSIPADTISLYLSLMLPTLAFNSICTVFEVDLRVQKRSVAFVAFSFGRLLVNIIMNVIFLCVLGYGVYGILLGNLITSVAVTLAMLIPFMHAKGRLIIRMDIVWPMVKFGAPLIVTTLLAFLMHNADRFILQYFLSMAVVGIYSLAYQIGQGVNTLILLPFNGIWGVVMYEIANDEKSRVVYREVFEYFTSFFMVVMLGVSVFIRPLLSVLVGAQFQEANHIVPIVCLAYVFFACNMFFEMAAKMQGQTRKLIVPSLIGAIVNILVNIILIPLLGVFGAALASVATFFVCSAYTLWVCNRIEHLRFPVARQAGLLLLGVGLYYLHVKYLQNHSSQLIQLMLSGSVVLLFASLAFAPHIKSRLLKGQAGQALQQRVQ